MMDVAGLQGPLCAGQRVKSGRIRTQRCASRSDVSILLKTSPFHYYPVIQWISLLRM